MKHSLSLVLSITALLALILVGRPALGQDAPPKGPSKEEVAAAVARLKAVLSEGSFEERVDALTQAESCLHDDVVSLVASATADDAREVRIAAAASLGRMHLPSSRKALHGLAKRKRLAEDVDLAVEVFKSIGRHGERESIDLLEDNLLGSPDPVAQARIMALGRIRHADSVKSLMATMNRIRVAPGAGDAQHMQELRLALHVLTGVDQGSDRRNWQRWWNDEKRGLVVAMEVPKLDAKLSRAWNRYWDEGATERRPRPRDEEEPAPEPEPLPEPTPPEPTPPRATAPTSR